MLLQPLRQIAERRSRPRDVRQPLLGRAFFFIYVPALTVTGVIFGGFHCFAWDGSFPIPVERLLWRISAMLSMVMPLLLAAVRFVTVKW